MKHRRSSRGQYQRKEEYEKRFSRTERDAREQELKRRQLQNIGVDGEAEIEQYKKKKFYGYVSIFQDDN